jgi:hypothetical protein
MPDSRPTWNIAWATSSLHGGRGGGPRGARRRAPAHHSERTRVRRDVCPRLVRRPKLSRRATTRHRAGGCCKRGWRCGICRAVCVGGRRGGGRRGARRRAPAHHSERTRVRRDVCPRLVRRPELSRRATRATPRHRAGGCCKRGRRCGICRAVCVGEQCGDAASSRRGSSAPVSGGLPGQFESLRTVAAKLGEVTGRARLGGRGAFTTRCCIG